MIKINIEVDKEKIKKGDYKWKNPSKQEIKLVKKVLKEFERDLKGERKI